MYNNGGQEEFVEVVENSFTSSATDLVGFLECQHLTSLDRAALSGHLERPERTDPVLDRIAQRGQLHEERFLESLVSGGLSALELELDHSLPRNERLSKGSSRS